MKYKFENIHSDGDLNKYVLLLWKGVCNYEYMYSWKKRLMKIHYHLEKVSIVTQISKIFLIPTINIKKKLCKNDWKKELEEKFVTNTYICKVKK